MGLGTRDERKYVSLFQGNFTLRVPEGTPNSITRTNKNGKQVTELHFTYIDGNLVDIKEKDGGEYGPQYEFIFNDGEQELVFTSGLKDAATSAIINRLPNLDLLSPMVFNVKYNHAKEKAFFWIDQHGEAVKDFFQEYDEENNKWIQHHGFPVWEKTIVNGQEIWDATKQINYQKKVVNKYFGFEAQSKRKAEMPEGVRPLSQDVIDANEGQRMNPDLPEMPQKELYEGVDEKNPPPIGADDEPDDLPF